MKCVYYQLSPSRHCPECKERPEVNQPKIMVNNLLQFEGDSNNNEWKRVNKMAFNTNIYRGNQNGKVLKFKYAPPKTLALAGQTAKSDGQINGKQNHSHQESYPEYLPLDNPHSKPSTSVQTSKGSQILDKFSSNSNFSKTELASAERNQGFWCVCSGSSGCCTSKTKLFSYSDFKSKTCPGRTLNLEERGCSAFWKEKIGSSTFASQQLNKKYNIQSLKTKYHITDYHRGKWLVTSSKENSSCLWKEICALISKKDLIHCNAKYQDMTKEIWLYCDFINSLDIHEVLQNKLHVIPQGLSYYIHPHGVIMTGFTS